jgi:hypothetical protein
MFSGVALSYIDTKSEHGDIHVGHSNGVNLINTVEDNRIKYSQRDYSKAVLARKIQKSSEDQARRRFYPLWRTTCCLTAVQFQGLILLQRSVSSDLTWDH